MISSDVVIVLAGIGGTIIVAVLSSYLTYRFTRKMQLEAERRRCKLDQYKEYLTALSVLLNRSATEGREAANRYSHAAHTLVLVAPQAIIEIINDLHRLLRKTARTGMSTEAHENGEELWRVLVLAIRKDLRIKPKDKTSTFSFDSVAAWSDWIRVAEADTQPE